MTIAFLFMHIQFLCAGVCVKCYKFLTIVLSPSTSISYKHLCLIFSVPTWSWLITFRLILTYIFTLDHLAWCLRESIYVISNEMVSYFFCILFAYFLFSVGKFHGKVEPVIDTVYSYKTFISVGRKFRWCWCDESHKSLLMTRIENLIHSNFVEMNTIIKIILVFELLSNNFYSKKSSCM